MFFFFFKYPFKVVIPHGGQQGESLWAEGYKFIPWALSNESSMSKVFL